MIMNLYRNIDRTKVQFDFVENSFEPTAYDEEILSYGGRIYRCPHFNGKNYLQYKKWWDGFFREHASEYRVVHGHIGNTDAVSNKISAKLRGWYDYKEGDNVDIAFSRKHFFDKESGESIERRNKA